MKIAYVMNTYPMTSTTFVRREIETLERLGVTVLRYAVRPWAEKLVDPRDLAEIERTNYLFVGNTVGLLKALLAEIARNPANLWKGLKTAAMLVRNSGAPTVKPIAYLLQAIFLKQHALENDVAHLHAHFSTNSAAVAMLARLMGGPTYSFTVHGPDEFDDAKTLSFDAKLTHAAFAVAISQFCKAQIIRFSSLQHADKIRIVHCGVDLSEFQPLADGAPANRTFVCVGRLCANKGQHLIPAAVAALKLEFPDLKVVLVGDGDTRAEVQRQIADLDIADNVELKGWLANREVCALVQSATAFLLPTFAEGLPVVLMEALALGRPAISTYVAGIPELIDSDCGWLVPAGSVEELVVAMRAALSATPEALDRLGANGRERIVADFDIVREAEKLKSLFEAVVSVPASSKPASSPAAVQMAGGRHETNHRH